MKYLFLLNQVGPSIAGTDTPEGKQLLAEYQEVLGAMGQAGVLLDCEPLQEPSSSTTVRVRNGETLITDGPAAEIKEHLGGYTIVECGDLDEALQWAARIPAAKRASIEVRPIARVTARV